MSTDPQKTPHMSPVLEFKSSTFFVPILILSSNDLAHIEQSLQEKIRLAPEFFKNSPLIIDVQAINKQGSGLDIIAITNMMRKIGLFPTGLRGGNKKQNKQARSLFIPIDTMRDNDSNVLSTLSQNKVPETQPLEPEEVVVVETPVTVNSVSSSLPSTPPTSESTTLLVTQPIRSGQRIYASGDLVILSQVSAGAEIMAEGNIHVYNTLRGRALAGVQGNADARIFCFDLQAELVSIAGDYKTSEDINKAMHKKPVQIYLQDRALIIKEIV